ncbi:MAG TPA: anti-sigma F factor [Firmicutes bacterium]|nr:anti-sigma F factor [Bacillota bacterium]
MKNQFKMTILSQSANESFSRAAVVAFIAQLDPTVDELADIKTAVSEAVTNCIVHAYREGEGRIYIDVKYDDKNVVTVKISDKGCGIEDVEQAMEPMYTTCTTGERAGLGFAVMQSFMDKLKVVSTPGKGTSVTMTKQISKKDPQDHE